MREEVIPLNGWSMLLREFDANFIDKNRKWYRGFLYFSKRGIVRKDQKDWECENNIEKEVP